MALATSDPPLTAHRLDHFASSVTVATTASVGPFVEVGAERRSPSCNLLYKRTHEAIVMRLGAHPSWTTLFKRLQVLRRSRTKQWVAGSNPAGIASNIKCLYAVRHLFSVRFCNAFCKPSFPARSHLGIADAASYL